MTQAENKETDLFDPVAVGAWVLQNRIVMAPLTRARVGENGVPGALQARYYAQRSSTGLIISEAVNISRQARGYAYTPGIFNEQQVEGWRQVTEAVHDAGGKIVCQLWHVGRFSHPSLQPSNALPVAPSAIAAEGETFTLIGMQPVPTPRALETGEIPEIVEQYRHAAACARRAGFDGVEVHAANCYLLEQFIRDSTNRRTDAYGGSNENRTRLVLDVVKAVVDEWEGGQHVGIRLSPVTPNAGNTPLDSDVMATYGYLIEKLNWFGLAYLHMVEGATGMSREIPEGVDLQALRAHFVGPYIANNLYTRELALAARREHQADLIAFGRPFIANPDLVERLKRNVLLAEAPQTLWYGGDEHGYTDWPTFAAD
ncbi:alkene reductase [Candidatus Methylospira mobilis]|uniref:Alkene reductase n=1 Tax=Candidatus Methylospira mobilis TaxID=1808979 RepID=A0A5Q0BJR5_9GAMM|nr:alkene reductase [Candidatus Methylospira mobilis]QFY44050.1 alkene reductase [Candidatus Methylospira mobilis]WNV05055.1 alkene reductase [Candidatus Methylospira mobilis]